MKLKNTLKRNLYLTCLLLSGYILQSQNTVTIGNMSTNYVSLYTPLDNYYNYSWADNIYLSSDIGQAGTITQIAFYVYEGDNLNISGQSIYMRETSATSFTNSTYPGTTGFTQVYSGNINYVFSGNSGWQVITLTTPFVYDGLNSLEVLCTNNSGSYSNNYQLFYVTNGYSNNRCKLDYYNGSFPSSCKNCGAYSFLTNCQLTINCTPSTTVTPTTATVCLGSGTTLTANGASTYTWSPTNGLSSTTGSVVTATPTITTTYSVASTNSVGCVQTYTAATITVKALPSLTLSPTSASYCTGGNANLTASGASSYTWTPTTGLSASTGSAVTASPTVTTTYTIHATGSNGCTNSATEVVTVNAYPTVSISPSNTTICNGTGATLTASGASTYTWSPSSGLSANTGSTVTASPTVTTNYTVSGTSNGCTSTAATSVNVTTVNTGTAVATGGTVTCSNSAVALSVSGSSLGTFVDWQSSTDNIHYYAVSGGTTENFNTAAQTSTYFKAQFSNGGCTAYSTPAYYKTNNNYYVNDNATTGDVWCTAIGNSSNDGRDPSRPQTTVDYILDTYTVGACDTIFVDAGNYTQEIDIYYPQGGNRFNYTTIIGAGINKTYLTAPSNGLNFYLYQPDYFKIQGFNMTSTQTNWPNVEFYEAGDNILTNNHMSHSGYSNVQLYGDAINCNNVQVLNNNITNSSTNGNAIDVEGLTDSTLIQGDTISMTNSGGEDAMIFYCYKNGSNIYYPANSKVSQNVVSAYSYGVSLYGNYYPISTFTINNNTITMNTQTVSDGSPIWLGGVGSGSTDVTQIYDNRLIGGNNGIYFSSGADYLNIYNNYISNNNYGVYVSNSNSNTNQFYFNSLYNSIDNLYFVSSSNSAWKAKNNILYTTSTNTTNANIFVGNNTTFSDCNYNSYYAPSGASTANFNGTKYATLSAWQGVVHSTATSHGDENSITGNPLYSNAASNILDVSGTTPVYLKGIGISGITTDIYNHTRYSPPSIGAEEPVPTANAGSNASICLGTNVTLNGSGGTNYSWSPSAGLSNTTIANPVASPTTTTVYTLTVTDGYESSTSTVTVTVLATPVITLSNASICKGTSYTMNPTVSGGGSAPTYSWSPATALSNTNTINPVATPTTTTLYSLTVNNTTTGCASTATINVTVNPIPSLTVAFSPKDTIDIANSATVTASGANTYTWSPATGLSATTGSIVVASPTVTTNYILTGVSAAGCVNTTTFSINVIEEYYFRSVASGNWNQLSTWQASPDSIHWIAATIIPSYAANSVVVQNTNTVTITASATVDQVTVNGTLVYGNYTGSVLTIHHGTGTDLTINGTFVDNSLDSITWQSSSNWKMGASGTLMISSNNIGNGWQNNYHGGISTIPATSNWILNNTGVVPTLYANAGMYYPNLFIENNSGSTWTTGSTSSFEGSAAPPAITGNLYIGGSNATIFLNSNTNALPLNVAGNFTLATGSTLHNYGTGINIQGNLYLYGIDSTTSSSYISVSGTNNQTITGTNIKFQNLIINKTHSTNYVTFNSPATITGAMTFSTGIVVTDTINLLTFKAGTSAYGVGNDSSFVSGPVKKIGNTGFTFPLGKGNDAQTISISAPSNITDAFQAEYFNTDPTAIYGSTTASTFNYVSTCQYFKLLRKNGTSNIQPTLSYDLTSCITYMIPDPRVTSFNGTEWIDLGESNFLYSGFGGTISTATTITQYGAITLGNSTTTPFNPLDTLFQLSNAGACGAIFISEYVQDTLGNCAIELYNPTNSNISLTNYYISATQNSSISYPPLQYALTGNIAPYHTFVVVNADAPSSTLRSKANQLIKNFNFNGKNAISLEYSSSIGILLDKIGDYAIPFTDSGWVISAASTTGCTRNHDLVRLKTIGEGNVQWASAQYEWVTYPMDTYTNLGWDSSICGPLKDPDLYLSLANGNTSCSSPSTFMFDVMAYSNPSTIFTYCDFHIMYDTTIFGGNIATASIPATVSQGSSFPSSNGYNAPTITNFAPNILDIQFGDPSSADSMGTMLPSSSSSALQLLTISIPIRSCSTAVFNFTDAISSNYTYKDSTSYQISDTTWLGTYTYSNPYNCNPYDCNPYPCGPYDSTCMCQPNTCYQTCYQTCYHDSTQNFTVTNSTGWMYTYHYTNYTNASYSGGSSITSAVCPINISSVYGTLDPNGALAGTGDIVTINGNGFSNTQGTIFVTNANVGSTTFYLDTTDIINWSENEIKIEMPNVMLPPNNLYTPGSGPIQVFNACNYSDIDNLNIYYNVKNGYTTSSHQKLKLDIIQEPNSPGSYYFRCDTSISHHDTAYACVKKAIARWNCVTGVNWILGPPDSVANNISADGVCRIFWGNSDPKVNLSTGFYANTVNEVYNVCGGDILSSDGDISIRKDITGYQATAWNYDTITGTIIPSYAASFYQLVLHEVGHVHLLGHVNSVADVMWRVTLAGDTIIDITTWPSSDQAAAHNVIDSSIANICTAYQMTPILSPGCSSLGIETITSLVGQLNVFPNPTDEDFTVSYLLNTSAVVQFRLMDYTGREILNVNKGKKSEGINNERVNIANLASGIYFLVVNINGESQTVRVIKP